MELKNRVQVKKVEGGLEMAVKFLYCKKAKSVFKELNQVMFVVELDERVVALYRLMELYSSIIQDALSEIVGRFTVPQVFINGKHIGGSDETVLGASLDLGMRFRVANEQREKTRPWLLSLEGFGRREIGTRNRRNWVVQSVTEDKELAPPKTDHSEEAKKPLLLLPNGSKILELFSSSSEMEGGDDDVKKMSSRAINASIVLGFGTLAVSKLLTIDHDYWHGWTLYEVL
ncbi:hypothetical protein V6N11_081361 [Hibiscus sabdariffa]|uniref:Glutaredoxin domain-containing protein n=1 Tax=Hibiscus sabdariffa TaxID=183260 RepID=A0ABR2QK45_9ROSI